MSDIKYSVNHHPISIILSWIKAKEIAIPEIQRPADLITHKGDVHHLFPKSYLRKNGFQKGRYNQIANYVMMQSEINIAIGDKAPKVYFSEILKNCENGKLQYGAIDDLEELKSNFKMHCIPDGMENRTFDDYNDFLAERRKLISNKIKNYYKKL